MVAPLLANPKNPNHVWDSRLASAPSGDAPMYSNSINAGPFGDISFTNTKDKIGAYPSDHAGTGVQSNQSIKLSYFADHSTRRQHDTVVDGFTFAIVKEPDQLASELKQVQFAMYSVSRINWNLQYNPKWRKDFGSMDNAFLLRKCIFDLGIQIGPTPGEYEITANERTMQTFVVALRAKFYSYWHALDMPNSASLGVVRPFDNLYWLIRRYEWKGALDSEFSPMPSSSAALSEPELYRRADNTVARRAPGTGGGIGGGNKRKVAAALDDLDEFIAESNAAVAAAGPAKKRGPGVSLTAPLVTEEKNKKNAKNGGGGKEYYWTFEPYISRDGKKPHPTLYTSNGIRDPNDITKYLEAPWVGAPIHVGKVWDGYGPLMQSSELLKTARKVMHPTAEDEEYKNLTPKLPQLEVFLKSM
jgi:hypothetical protein